jgi:hypothetical protein
MSTLKVNSILDTSGNDTVTGKILQVKYTQYDTRSSQSISASTVTALDNMSVTITPSSTNSKILLLAQWNGEFSNTAVAFNGMLSFLRNSTYIGAEVTSRNYGIMPPVLSYYADEAGSTMESGSWKYLDSPATTSSITYYGAINSYVAITMYHNRTVSDINSNGYEQGVSSIMAMEIGQ